MAMKKALIISVLFLLVSHSVIQAQGDEMTPLITDVSQLSSPFSDYLEGTDIGALIDNDPYTFWHSDWHNQYEGDYHWIDISLNSPESGTFCLYMHRRNSSNDHPTKVLISGSDDGNSWHDIFTAELPYNGFTEVVSDFFTIKDALNHIRLTVIDCTGAGTGFRKLWHAAEIQIYKVSEQSGFSTDISNVRINEVQVANIDRHIDNSYNYGAWIELYNTSDTLCFLNGTTIRHTDADGITETYGLYSGHGSIKGNGFACLWFDHNSKDGNFGGKAHLQIPFKLDPEGGFIELMNNDGKVVDSLEYPPAIARCAYARKSDGDGEWGWTAFTTPGKSNLGSVFAEERVTAPVISKESTLFTDSISFNVEIPEGTTLIYTTDGSTPTIKNGSISDTGRFTTTSTAVYRFVLIADGKLPSRVVTRTFIKDGNNLGIPVLCISTAPDNLYNDTIGVYTKGTNGIPGNGQNEACNWNMDWERPVNVEYLIKESGAYRPVLNQEAEFKIAGGWSRAYGGDDDWAMKSSFRLKTGKVYEGKNSFDYPIFADSKPHNRYKTLQVRNGGNDTYARIYDAALHEIFLRSGFYIDCQAWQPCHVFFNGKYLGMLNIRENNNKHYGESGYGIDTDEIDQFELNSSVGYEQKAGTRDAFWQWLTLTKQLAADPTNQEIWQQICNMVDIDEFCNYMAAECYIGCSDWLTNSNNIKGFRSKKDNGKFHLVMFDTDSSFGTDNMISSIYSLLHNYDGRYSDNDGKSFMAEIFFNMLEYEPFKRQFIHAFSIVDGSVMEPERCKEIIDGMVAYIRPALAIEGNDPTASADRLYNNISSDSRRAARMSNMKSFMNLTQEFKVTLESNIPEARLLIDGQEVPTRKFNGTLFGPVSITTKAPAGYIFKGWQMISETEASEDLIPFNSDWHYYDKGSLDNTDWKEPGYNDTAWGNGNAPFGYGTVGTTAGAADYNTTLDYGGNASEKRPTYYFRKTFMLNTPPISQERYTLYYYLDDGAIFYVNGVEVGSYHCLSGSTYNDFSTEYESNTAAYGSIRIPDGVLHEGSNTITVEVHNTSFTSSDIFFDARLTKATPTSISTDNLEELILDETTENGTHHIIAVYERLDDTKQLLESGASPVLINEVSAGNDIYINDHYKKNDWVELYNTTSNDIDISGMYLSDTRSNPQKYRISAESSSASTIIPAYGKLIIWCDKLQPIDQLHAPFKLDNADGACVTLQSEDGSWYDEMIYQSQDKWQTYGRYPDGGQHSSYLERPSIARPNMMMSYDYINENITGWESQEMAITLELGKGWNWVSHNLNNWVHKSRFTGHAQHIMGQSESYIKEDSVWTGTFSAMFPATGYKMKMSADTDITLRGLIYDTAEPVKIKKGWNWIGCPLYNATTLEAAFKEYTPTEGDAIIGINAFATYEEGEWEGTLTMLSPGQAYLIKCNTTQTFRWSSLSAPKQKSRRYAAPQEEAATGTPWQTDMHAYPNAIGVIAVLDDYMPTGRYTVAAFCGDECRGIAEEINSLLYINIYGEENDVIKFRLMESNGEILDLAQSITLTPETIIGSRKSPLQLGVEQTCIHTPSLSGSRIVSVEYYTLNGQCISKPVSGIIIRKTVYENGDTEVKKIRIPVQY